jgi:hypothetical protein
MTQARWHDNQRMQVECMTAISATQDMIEHVFAQHDEGFNAADWADACFESLNQQELIDLMKVVRERTAKHEAEALRDEIVEPKEGFTVEGTISGSPDTDDDPEFPHGRPDFDLGRDIERGK